VPSPSIRRGRDVPIAIDTFAEAEPNRALGDFASSWPEITGSRLVSRFGGAINLSARALPALLAGRLPSRPGTACQQASFDVSFTLIPAIGAEYAGRSLRVGTPTRVDPPSVAFLYRLYRDPAASTGSLRP
jgi:hypothetical protein